MILSIIGALVSRMVRLRSDGAPAGGWALLVNVG